MKAVIFDLDGVLSDGQKIHSLVEHILFKELGANISEKELTERFSGMQMELQFNVIMKEHGKTGDFKEFEKKKDRVFLEHIKDNIVEIEGALEMVKWLISHEVSMAIATSNRESAAKVIMESLGLDKLVPVIVTADDIKKGKPEPDIFLKAGELLNAAPENCIVVEDGKSGIKGAKKAGMTAVSFGAYVEGLGDHSARDIPELQEVLKELLELS